MEKYVNNDTVIDNEMFKIFKPSVTCPLCKNIFIKPVMSKCQNVYCKNCIDNWSKNNTKCPNNCCEEPEYQNCIFKNEILSQLKFYCVGCGKELAYNEAENHHNSCCPNKTSADMDKSKKKKKFDLIKLSPDEVKKLTDKGKELTNIFSM